MHPATPAPPIRRSGRRSLHSAMSSGMSSEPSIAVCCCNPRIPPVRNPALTYFTCWHAVFEATKHCSPKAWHQTHDSMSASPFSNHASADRRRILPAVEHLSSACEDLLIAPSNAARNCREDAISRAQATMRYQGINTAAHIFRMLDFELLRADVNTSSCKAASFRPKGTNALCCRAINELKGEPGPKALQGASSEVSSPLAIFFCCPGFLYMLSCGCCSPCDRPSCTQYLYEHALTHVA